MCDIKPDYCAIHKMIGAEIPVLASKVCEVSKVKIINGEEENLSYYNIPVCKKCAALVKYADAELLHLLLMTSFLANLYSSNFIEEALLYIFTESDEN